jgi:hypothetical protein
VDWGAQPKSFWWLLLSATAMVLGGLGPWATAFGALSVSGTSGDGWLLIAGGAVAVALTVVHVRRQGRARWPMIVVGLIGSGCAIAAIIDLGDIASATDGSDLLGDAVSPGWGIWLSVASSASLALASILALSRSPRANALLPAPAVTADTADGDPGEPWTCDGCGAESADDARFCPHCGVARPDASAPGSASDAASPGFAV